MSENPYQAPEAESTPLQYSQQSRFGPVRDISTLAAFCKVMLLLNIILGVGSQLYTMSSHYEDYMARLVYGMSDTGAFTQFIVIAVVGIVVFILTVIAVCMWTSKAMANTWAIGKVRPQITPGWASGWYFIPFANLWKPYEAMSEIWRGVFGYTKTRTLLLLWWLSWILSYILGRISAKMSFENMDYLQVPRIIDIVSSLLSVIAAVSLLKIIGVVSKYQNSKAGLN